MKKKLVFIFVILMLVVSLTTLTACGLFNSGSNGSDSNYTDNKNVEVQVPEDNTQNDTPTTEDEEADSAEITLVCEFDLAVAENIDIVVPNPSIDESVLDGVVTEEEADEIISEIYKESMRDYLRLKYELQVYVNDINTSFKNAKLSFYNNNKVDLTFYENKNGVEESYIVTYDYSYKRSTGELQIYTTIYQHGQTLYAIEYEGVVDFNKGTILLYQELDEDGLMVVYLEFSIM